MNASSGFVVDASVAIKWHLHDEVLVDEAAFLLREFTRRRVHLIAPSLIRYEVANSFEQARRRQRIDAAQAAAEFQSFIVLGVHNERDTDDLVAAARNVASELGTSVYDGVYVALAEREALPLLTDDARLLRQIEPYPVAAHHLSEVSSLL